MKLSLILGVTVELVMVLVTLYFLFCASLTAVTVTSCVYSQKEQCSLSIPYVISIEVAKQQNNKPTGGK